MRCHASRQLEFDELRFPQSLRSDVSFSCSADESTTPPCSLLSLSQQRTQIRKPRDAGRPPVFPTSGQGARLRKALIAAGKLSANVRSHAGMCCASLTVHVSAHAVVDAGCVQPHLPPQHGPPGTAFLLGMCPRVGNLARTHPIIWLTEKRLDDKGKMTRLIYSQATTVNGWQMVDDWGSRLPRGTKELHWSAEEILQVARAPCVPYMRVACLQQAKREAEDKEHPDLKDAANKWLDAHWRPWTALQGTQLFRHVVLGQLLHLFSKDTWNTSESEGC